MKRKKLTIAGICCIAAGIICTVWGIAAYDRERCQQALGVSDFTTVLQQDVSSIKLDVDYADVILKTGSENDGSVSAYNINAEQLTVSVSDGVLEITLDNSREFLFTNFTFSPSIIITLPEHAYDTIDLSNACGNISIDGFQCSTLSVLCRAGSMQLSGCTADAGADFFNQCGNISLTNVQCPQGTLTVQNQLGHTELERCSFYCLSAVMNCGNLKLNGCMQTANTSENGEKQSAITNENGNITITDTLLYNANILNSCGNITASGSSLLGKTAVQSHLGAIRLSLLGGSADYDIYYSPQTDSQTDSGRDAIYIDTTFTDQVKITYEGNTVPFQTE